MNKKDAARFLEISEKTLERIVKRGELSATMQKQTGKRPIVVFDDVKLEQYKQFVTSRQTATQTDNTDNAQTTRTRKPQQVINDDLFLRLVVSLERIADALETKLQRGAIITNDAKPSNVESVPSVSSDDETLLSSKDVAQRLNVGVRQARSLMRDKMNARNINGKNFVAETDFKLFEALRNVVK